MSERSSIKANPNISSTFLRGALRPILRAVIRRPGRLYQPLFLGPVPSIDLIEAEVQSLVESEGLPVYFGFGEQARRVCKAGTPAVFILDPTGAEELLGLGYDLPVRQQVIVWSERSLDALSGRLASWVMAQGLAFNPARHARTESGAWTMGPTLVRCARDPGSIYNPVVLLAPASALALIADEAALRLEAAGLQPVVALSESVYTDEPAVARVGRQGAVVLRMALAPSPATVAGIESLIDRGIQVVLVSTPEVQAQLSSNPMLHERAISLIVAGGAEQDQRGRRAELMLAAHPWPPIADILAAPPVVGAEPERTMAGSLETFPLPDLLQTFGGGRHSGRLVAFTQGHLGTLDIERGRVRSAWVMGDIWQSERFLGLRGAGAARLLVEERACEIGQWQDADFTFVKTETLSAPDSLEAEVMVDSLSMEIARRMDEAPRLAQRIGGLGWVWSAVSGAESAAVDEMGRRVLDSCNGVRTVQDIALSNGLLSSEIMGVIADLAGQGLIEPSANSVMVAPSPLPIQKIAGMLLSWGFKLEAMRLLGRAEALQQITPEGRAILGHLYAPSDPQAAVIAFRKAAGNLTGAALLDAKLNALLLEVRGRQQPATVVWEEVQRILRILQEGGREYIRSARHYAIITELAMRAGDRLEAEAMLRTLQDAGTEGKQLSHHFVPSRP